MTTYISNRDGTGLTDEQGHHRFQNKFLTGNVLTGMAVTQNSPLARNVLVAVGDIKIDYGTYSYTGWMDAAEVVAISTADPSNPRIDRIIAYVDRGMTSGGTNNPGYLKFVAVSGTPGAVPVKASDATVNSAVGASNPWCELATVRVEAGATTIANSKITDTRTLISIPNNVATPTNGWNPSLDTWVYVGADQFKIVGVDRTAIYKTGTRLMFTQTTTKYGVVRTDAVMSGSDTLVSIAVNTDYTIANAAITNNFYSYAANPQGYPGYFNFNMTVASSSGTLTSYTAPGFYSINGRTLSYAVTISVTNVGTGSGAFVITLPVASNTTTVGVYGNGRQDSTGKQIHVRVKNSTTGTIYSYDNMGTVGAGSVNCLIGTYFIG